MIHVCGENQFFPASSFLGTESDFGNDFEAEDEVVVGFVAVVEVAVDGSRDSREMTDLVSPGTSTMAGSSGTTATTGVSKAIGVALVSAPLTTTSPSTAVVACEI